MGEVADLYVTLRANTAQFTSGWAKAVATGETGAAKVNAATSKIAKYSVLGLAGIGLASVKMAGDFSDSINRVNNLAMGGKGNVQALSSSVLDLAGKVGFSPNNLADALYHIESNFYSVGLGGKQALNALQIAAEGAKVGNADLVDVTNALGAAVASGIPGVQNYSKAMGMLLATVGSGDMTMQNLADAFSTGILAIGKQYGATMQDMGAALATFGDNNIRGQVAATDLRMAIMDLTKQGKPGVAALESIGLAQGQLAHDMQTGGLRKALTDLKTHLDDAGISGTKVGQFLETAFTKKSSAPLAVLIDQMDRFNSKFPALEEGANKFGDDWTSQTHQFKQVWSTFVSQFEADLIKVGQQLLPTATSAMQALGAGFDWIGSNIGTILTLGEYLAGAAAGFYLLKLATMAWAAIQWISSVVQGAAAFISLATEIRSAKEAQVLLSMAMTDTPWGAVASLVGVTVVAAFKLFGKSSSNASQAADQQRQAVQSLADTYDNLTGAITKATSTELLKTLQGPMKGIPGASPGIGSDLSLMGDGANISTVDLAAKMGINQNTLIAALEGSAGAAKTLNTQLNAYAKTSETALGEVADLRNAFQALTGTVNDSAETDRRKWISTENLTAALKGVKGGADVANGAILSNTHQVAELAAKYNWSGQQIQTVINAYWPPAMAKAEGVTVSAVQQIEGTLGGLPGQAQTVGTNLGAGLARGITFSIGNAVSAAAQLAAAAIHAAQTKLQVKSPSRVFFELGQWTGEGLAMGIESKTGRVTSSAQALATAGIKAAATAPTGTATRVRRESAKKALSMDLPTYLEAAAAAGYTTHSYAGVSHAQPIVVHLTSEVKLDGKRVGAAMQKHFLRKELIGTSNGLSRRRSSKV